MTIDGKVITEEKGVLRPLPVAKPVKRIFGTECYARSVNWIDDAGPGSDAQQTLFPDLNALRGKGRWAPVGIVDVEGGQPVASAVEHGCERPPPKVICQFCPVTVVAAALAGFGAGIAKAAVPVEQCPSGIEGQCPDAHQTHGISTVAPSVVPCSMASLVSTASSSACS